MTKNTKMVLILILAVVLIAAVPLFALRGAEFGGSDDAGSVMVEEITGDEYEPWFTPVLETVIGGELPGEVESLFSASRQESESVSSHSAWDGLWKGRNG